MRYSEVKNCQYSNDSNTGINCTVLFENLGWVEFTASPDDVPHSKEIYERAQAGEFGSIQPYVSGPSNVVELSLESKIRSRRNALLSDLDQIVTNPLRWASLSQELQQDYARYRQELLDVPQQQNFPTDVKWPTPPIGYVESSFQIMMISK